MKTDIALPRAKANQYIKVAGQFKCLSEVMLPALKKLTLPNLTAVNDAETEGVEAIQKQRPWSLTMKTLLVQTLEEWREWLEENHASESEVWLVFHKKHTGVPSIDYKDALDESLCFGWVDSLVKRLDDRRYARKFTPRRADSRWSAVNRERYAVLKAAGRLKPPGIECPPTNRRDAPRQPRLEMPAKLPAYIQAALKKHPVAMRHFEALPPSHRRRYFAWIESAKREETKLRRLEEAIRMLSDGKELGLK